MLEFLASRWPDILFRAYQHGWLVVQALAIATVIGVALAVLVSDMESFRFIAGQDELEHGYAPDLEVFEHLEPGMIVLLRQDDCDVLICVVEHLDEGESMLDYLRDAADDLDAEGSPNWRFKASRGCWDG